MQLRPGEVIAGRLRLVEPLGSGGMGVVWAAVHLALGTEVAVKLIRPERAAADPALLARFEREARATARIVHPHVVRVTDYGTVDGAVPYLVMERLHGFSLDELFARGGRLSVATAVSLVHQVSGALRAAHALGIVHRDVKPQNIFVTEGRVGQPLVVKVLDFGVAKVLDEGAPGASPGLTESGVVVGSAPYMSPEQLRGSRDVDLRSDLWSLGVIVYEALTGARPFQGASLVTVGAAVIDGRYRPAQELRPDLPAALDHWFAKALCVDEDGRFQSAGALEAAFAQAAAHRGTAGDGAETSTDAGTGTDADADAGAGVGVGVGLRAGAEAGAGAGGSHTAPHPSPAAAPTRVTTPIARRRRAAGVLLAAAAAAVVGVALAGPRGAADEACPAGMVRIHGAEFAEGSPAEGETPTDETPLLRSEVAAFCIDATEVPVRAYAACARCAAPRTVDFEGLTPNGRAFESQFCNGPDVPDHPMNCVDWSQAAAYCASVGKRLPTETEWELAARGPARRTFPWGEEAPSEARLNACGVECSRMLGERRARVGKGPWPAMHERDDGAPATAAVGHYLHGATPEGVLDLAGNVWEWTASAYCAHGSPDCGDSRRVLRGGGWDTTEGADVRAARRLPSAPAARGRSIGFRCAR